MAADRCPACGGDRWIDTVRRSALPTMQNYVYRSREHALGAPRGEFVLAVCRTCGFAWNRTFDGTLVRYDEGYDNAVPSDVMRDYYRQIADHLRSSFSLAGGLIVDVGCGNGTFLRTICDAVPGARGLGVDPALERSIPGDGGQVTLVKDVFRGSLLHERPSLLVSRHVLEHIESPVSFLSEINGPSESLGPFPCFFEVPDLRWIIEKRAFWDFCYEHCNYFTGESLAEAVRRAGFATVGVRNGFGGQYLWLEASSGSATRDGNGVDDDFADRLLAYAEAEREYIAGAQARIARLRESGSSVVIWGMATKGVLFSILVDPAAELVDHCIDINPKKQGCFVPLTGQMISAPASLEAETGHLMVIVMNENYCDEVAATCRGLHLTATVTTVDEVLCVTS
jgi:hypothetical protein